MNGSLALRIEDRGITAVIRNCVYSDNSYSISGKNTREELKNKKIVDLSNEVAAGSIVSGGAVYRIEGTPEPGNALVMKESGALGWGGITASSRVQILHVRAGGDDENSGTDESPFATIRRALEDITDASFGKRYVVKVGPGDWGEDISLTAWVFLVGEGALTTRLNGSINLSHHSWSNGGDNNDTRGGLKDFSIRGSLDINFSAHSGSPYGKFYLTGCWVNNPVSIVGISEINQVIVEQGRWFGGFTASSVNISSNGMSNHGGSIILNGSPIPCTYVATGGANLGELVVNGGRAATTVSLHGSPTAKITVGAGGVLAATSDSLPTANKISSAGTIVRLTDANSLAYGGDPRYWQGAPPATITAAIDRIAAAITKNGGQIL